MTKQSAKPPAKKSRTLWIILALVIGIPVIAVALLLASFDADRYRPQIADALTKQLGRAVTLGGPIKLGLSFTSGLALSVSNISVANPSGASRPLMATIGQAELGVGIAPLLEHQVQISAFKLSGADILLETSSAGQNNWDFQITDGKPATTPSEPTALPTKTQTSSGPVAVRVDNVDISNTKLALRGKDGKLTVFTVDSLTLDNKADSLKLHFAGNLAGAPVKLDVNGDALERITSAKWPFTADGTYANYKIHAVGNLANNAKTINLGTYTLSAGDTDITGQMIVALGGARPLVTASVKSGKLTLADLKPQIASAVPVTQPAPNSPAAASAGQRLFSATPLPLDALKAVDARLDIAIDELEVGPSAIKQLTTTVNLTNGRLLVAPLKMILAGSNAEGQVKLDASTSPAQASAILNAQQIDLSQLASLGGLESFITGKSDLTLDLTTSGGSMHDFASNANGQVSMIAAGGTLSSQVLGKIGNSLLEALSPGSGSAANPALNCMAARFKVANGVMQSDGLLLDTSQATIYGTGTISLRDENMNLVIHTKTKGVNVGDYAPPVGISGPLRNPHISADTAGAVQKVAGLLMGTGPGDSGVPNLVDQGNQNACLYTLDHAAASKPVQGGAVQDAIGKARDQLDKATGGKLLQGLGGLFGH